MNTLFDIVSSRLGAGRLGNGQAGQRLPGRGSRCHCRTPIFFNNSFCLSCHAALGYVPPLLEVRSFLPGRHAGEWRLAAEDPSPGSPCSGGSEWRRCANFDSAAGCNWMVEAGDPWIFCLACRLNRMIPNLANPKHAEWWGKVEAAKRRLIAQLLELGLPVQPKSEDDEHGLAFEFLATLPGQPRVITGHASGVITLNVEEADDVVREQMRTEMDEPSRTLLGHFRHEIGHYYWDRLVAGSSWLTPFRKVFGDERADYAQALRQHYSQPPPPDWAMRHVSAYASVHPWEDWAETWAHYLQIADTLATAVGFGLGSREVEFRADPFGRDSLHAPNDPRAEAFLSLINGWVELAAVLNEFSRSLGQRDLCPFVLSKTAVRKIHFVHLVITNAGAPVVPLQSESQALRGGSLEPPDRRPL